MLSISSTYLSHSEKSTSPTMNLSRISSAYFSMSDPAEDNTRFSSSVYVNEGHDSSDRYGSSVSVASREASVVSEPIKYSWRMTPGGHKPTHARRFLSSSSTVKPSGLFIISSTYS